MPHPWRIGQDAVTSGNTASLASARKMNSWIKSKTGGNPNNIAVGYSLGLANWRPSETPMRSFTPPWPITT